MSADKYPTIFSRQMNAIVYVYLRIKGSIQRTHPSHASTSTSNMRKLSSVWLISTFGKNKQINDKILRLRILVVFLLT